MAPVNPWGNAPFPEADGDSETLAFHTPTFREVAAKLRADLWKYEKAPADLRKAGQLQNADVGEWQAGADLLRTLQQTHASVRAIHEAFVMAYQDLIHRLEASAGAYDDAEDRTALEIRRLLGPADERAPRESPTKRPADPHFH